MEDFLAHADLMLKERLPAAATHKPAEPKVAAPPAVAAAAAAASTTVAH
jgi:hypothetical protein